MASNSNQSFSQRLFVGSPGYGKSIAYWEPITTPALEEIDTLALWASISDPETSFDELRQLPITILAELYNASISPPNAYGLKPAGSQWEAFTELLTLAQNPKDETDLDAISNFFGGWVPYMEFATPMYIDKSHRLAKKADLKYSYDVEIPESGLSCVPETLPACYTINAILHELRTNCSIWDWSHQIQAGRKIYTSTQAHFTLLHSASPLFTPWAPKTETMDEARLITGARTAEQEENAIAPLRVLAEHFFGENSERFNGLFHPVADR